MAIAFINADLEITSDKDLGPIAAAFARYGYRFFELYCGELSPGTFYASFEIHPDKKRDDQTAEEKIHAFCDSISELQGEARNCWYSASKRVIDVGYLSDDHCKGFHDLFSMDVLHRMESLKIDLALTIYPQNLE